MSQPSQRHVRTRKLRAHGLRCAGLTYEEIAGRIGPSVTARQAWQLAADGRRLVVEVARKRELDYAFECGVYEPA
jgi:microsomal dipeptidase-like Zn-dependent dipeptidase